MVIIAKLFGQDERSILIFRKDDLHLLFEELLHAKKNFFLYSRKILNNSDKSRQLSYLSSEI